MTHSKRKFARTVLLVALSILLTASTALATVRISPRRASATGDFKDIVKSEKLTTTGPEYKEAPSEMDNGSISPALVFNLAFGNSSPYTYTTMSAGYEKAQFASTAGTKYAGGASDAFYISSEMVTGEDYHNLFSTAGTTMSFTKPAGTQDGYFVFDFQIGGELLSAGLDAAQLFGMLGLGVGGDGATIEGHFNTAQLFYKMGEIGEDEMNAAIKSSAAIGLAQNGMMTGAIVGTTLDDYNDADKELKRAAWMTDSNNVATSSAVVSKGDGWYQARIPVGAGAQTVSLGFTFGTTRLFSAFVDAFFAIAKKQADGGSGDKYDDNVQSSGIDSYLVIRNVDFKETGDVTAESINVTVDGADISAADLVTAQVEGDVQTGKRMHLTLNEGALNGKTFYGWDIDGEFYSGKDISVAIMNNAPQVKAIVGDANAYEARIGTTFYPKFTEALAAANNAGTGTVTVTVPKGQTLSLDASTVNKGVTVVLPYDESGNGYASGVAEGRATGDLATGFAWEDEGKYRHTVVEMNGALTVNGNLVVGGVINAPDSGAQSRTSGNYAELINNSSIIVNGTVNVYGRITGSGTIEVRSGGRLAEPFLILDYATGEIAADTVISGLVDAIKGNTATTPFLRYAMINVENKMTVNYGGQLYGYLSLYALGHTVSFDQPIVGKESDECFMMLSPGASVEIKYDKNTTVTTDDHNGTKGIGKTTMNFTGGAKFGPLTLTVFGISFQSRGFVFSIPYNFDISLGGNVTYEFDTEFMLMPGATLTVEAGATLNLTHAFWTLDGYEAEPVQDLDGHDKTYPSADALAAAGYSKSGNFIVNGNLHVNGGTAEKKVTFLGIVQTTGSTGTMTIGQYVDTGTTAEYSGDYSAVEVDRVIYIGKVRSAQAGIEAAPDAEDSEAAEAEARAIKFFMLTSPARVNGSVALKAGQTYVAKDGTDWTLKSYKYLGSFALDAALKEVTIEQTMHGNWTQEHVHSFDWNFTEEEMTFGKDEPAKFVTHRCTGVGCEVEDTKLLINGNWALHVPYTGIEYGTSGAENAQNLSAIFKNVLYHYILEKNPQQNELIEKIFYQEDWDNYIKFTMLSENGFIRDPGDFYTLSIAFENGSNGVSCAWVIEDGTAKNSATLNLTVDPVDLSAAEKAEVSYTVIGQGTFTLNDDNPMPYDFVGQNKEIASDKKITITINGAKKYSYFTADEHFDVGASYTVDFPYNYALLIWSGTTLTIKGDDTNFTGEYAWEYPVKAAQIAKVEVTGEVVYQNDGQAVTVPDAQIKVTTDHGYAVPAGEYTVSYVNNNGAGEATITVNGNGTHYTGTATATFTIKGTLEIMVGAGLLTKPYGVDGTSDLTFTLTGARNSLHDGVSEADILKAMISLTCEGTQANAAANTYNIVSALKTDSVSAGGKTVSGTTLQEILGIYKTITFVFGETRVECKAPDYTVTAKGAYTVTALDLANAEVNVTASVAYTGSEIAAPIQSVTVKTQYDGKDVTVTLTDSDYTVTYSGAHTNVGTVNFTVESKTDNCTGKKDGSFEITHKIIDIQSVTVGALTYTGAQLSPKVTVTQTVGGELAANAYTATFAKDGVSTVLNAGDYTVTIAPTNQNWKFTGTTEVTFTVQRASIAGATIKVNGTYTYNGTAQTVEKKNVTVTVQGITGAVTFDIDAGSYQNNTAASKEGSKATFTVKGTGNFTGTASGEFTIAKKKITVTANDITGTYGDPAPTAEKLHFTVPADALAGNDGESVLNITLTLQEAEKYVCGAEYTISGTGTADNYDITVTSGKYTVQKKTITVTINEQKVTYNAKKQTAQSRYNTDWTVAGLVEGDEYTALNVQLTAGGDCTNAGNYTITGTYNAQNYTVNFEGGTGKFVIEKKGITVKANNINLAEGATADFAKQQLKVTVTGLENDGNDVEKHIKLEIENFNEQAKVQDTFVIKASFEAGYDPDNYEVTEFQNGTLTIIDSVFKDVVFNAATAEYSGTNHTLTATNLPQNAHAAYTYYKDGAEQGSDGVKNAGTYQVKVVISLAGYQNYEKTVNFTVSQKKIEITADNVNKTYGDALLQSGELTFSVAQGMLVGGDTKDVIKANLSWPMNRAANDYTISGTATADNYEITVTPGTYHIAKKAVTVTVKQQTWAIYTGKTLSAKSTEAEWEVGALAWGEQKSVLGVVLTASGTAAGRYEIKGAYNEQGNYTVAFTGGNDAFVIAARSVKGATITVTEQNIIYKAAQWRPQITVTLEGFEKALTADTDFNVTYGDNRNAGENAGSVTVKGTGNFCEEETVEFTIKPMDLGAAQIKITEQSIVYKAAQWQPQITVTLTNFGSLSGTADFTVEYGENFDAGEGSITVKGTGNFSGTVNTTFTIEAATLTAAAVTENYTYTGKEIKAALSVTAGTLTGLVAEQDYTVTYASNTNAGEATATVVGTGNFKGTVQAKFTIAPKDIEGATVRVSGNYVYNGSAIVPEEGQVTVTLRGYESVTYTFTAEDNISASEAAQLVVKGNGNFTGTARQAFTIAPKPISVTLQDQEFVYSGQIPVPDNTKVTVNSADLCSKNGEKDDLGITVTLVAPGKDVAEYALTASASNTDYAVSFIGTAHLTVTQKPITVRANDVSTHYGDEVATLTYTAEGLVEGEAAADVLTVTLRTDRAVKNAGTYTISGSGSAKNYTFTVEEGIYTVAPKEITVTIQDHSKLYDGKEPTVPAGAWSAPDGAILSGDNLQIVLTKEPGVNVKEGGYAITGTFKNDNYHVTFVNGKFTIEPRTVNVEIENQSAIYNYKHEYALSSSMWHIVEGGDGLLAGETEQMLGIALTTDEMTGAGTYAIRGTWTNGNYAITFKGAYTSQDEDNGHAGVYSIAKMDVSADAIFILTVEGRDVVTDSLRLIRTTFAGDPLTLNCQITYFEGDSEEGRALTALIDPATLENIGDFTVTVTIEDANYCGSTKFEVIVSDAEGYTQRLKDTLARLEAIAGNKTAADLTVEDFETVKEINGLLSALDDTERKVAGNKLDRYEALVEGWRKLADLDDMIETAETVADAPIAALFGAVAAISALAAVCYVIGKGGLL